MMLMQTGAASDLPNPGVGEAAMAAGGIDEPASIDDGCIRVTVDEEMNMAVFRNDGSATDPVWTPMTSPIEKMGASGGTAVTGGAAWANALPWSTGTGTATANHHNNAAKILSGKSGYVTTWDGAGSRAANGNDQNEKLLTDEFAVTSAVSETNVKTHFGTGARLTVVGKNDDCNLERTLVVETSLADPGVVAVSTYYKYTGSETAGLAVTKFVENNYKIEDVTPEKKFGNNIDSGVWTFQGSGTEWGRDYVMPVFDTMGVGNCVNFNATFSGLPGTNATSRNNWHWAVAGSVPYNNYFGTNVGIGIGSFMPYHVYGLELPTRGSGITNNHNIAYAWVGWPGKTLAPGKDEYIGTSFVAVHDGDFYSANQMYASAMSKVDTGWCVPFVSDLVTLPASKDMPAWAWAPLWETWGYGTGFNPGNIMDKVGEFQQLGIESVTLDDRWYARTDASGEGMYLPDLNLWSQALSRLNAYEWKDPALKAKYSGVTLSTANNAEGIKVIRAFNDYMHDHGIKVVAWGMSSVARGGASPLLAAHPDWYARNASGGLVNGGSSTSFLCLGNPSVIDEFTDYFCNLIFDEYSFDGLKGDSIQGQPPCYATGHGHDGDPEASMRGSGPFYKTIYDKANLIRGATATLGGPIVNPEKTAVIMNCNCGSPHNFFNYSGVNRPVPGDNLGSRQTRYLLKSFKGFYGADFPVVGDHLMLSIITNTNDSVRRPGPVDYISHVGAGAVLDTKYVTDKFNPLQGSMPDVYPEMKMRYPWDANSHDRHLTDDRYEWDEMFNWFNLYSHLSLSSKEMIGEAYKYAFDYPEGYVYRDDASNGDRYYSFFATSNAVTNGSQGFKSNSAVAVDPWGSGYESSNKFNGDIELRELDAGASYEVTDCVTGSRLGGGLVAANSEGIATIAGVSFTTGIILKASKVPSFQVYGKVTGAGSVAVPGTALSLFDKNGNQVGASVMTGPDGLYRFVFAAPGDGYYIKAIAWNGDSKVEEGIAVAAADVERNIGFSDLSIQWSYNVTGRIYYNNSGTTAQRPPAGVLIQVVDKTDGSVVAAAFRPSSANAGYVTNSIPPSDHDLAIVVTNVANYARYESAPFRIADQNLTRDIVLNRIFNISGKVTAADAPGGLAGATVQLLDATDNDKPVGSPVLTNSTGDYTIANATAGTYKISVKKEGYDEGIIDQWTIAASNTANVTGKNIVLELYSSASVYADAESDIAKNVCFTLALRGVKNVLTFEAEFVIDGSMLSGIGAEGLNGFSVIDGIAWRSMGGDLWRGTVTLAYNAGNDEGLTSIWPVDIAKFVFAPRAVGDAVFELAGVKSAGLVGDVTEYLDIKILSGKAVTNIDQRTFSKYDLNRDGIVDALDLGIMLLYCGFDKGSPNWETLVKVNDSRGKGVTASICDVNSDGVIDMLDLLDLFIHYTK
ncbi:MAG: carboxypeptidase regulatory-like domain-containing protein [Clostridiales bacterium]|nr:carboxypeptidase regulatory-like domain-containing protein [Clostridiales bacterium]